MRRRRTRIMMKMRMRKEICAFFLLLGKEMKIIGEGEANVGGVGLLEMGKGGEGEGKE